MKILEVCTSKSWGGMEMRTLKFSDHFRNEGHDITLLSFPGSFLNREAKQIGIKTIDFPFYNPLQLHLIIKLKKILKRNSFEIIHLQYSKDLQFVIPASKNIKKKIPVVLTKRVGSFINKKDLYHKYLYSGVDLITTISKVIKRNVLDTCPVLPHKVEVIYNGIDIKLFQEAIKRREIIRKRMNISDEVIIGMFGRFSPGKGHEELLKAAIILLNKGYNIKFWIIGEASFGEESYAKSIYELSDKLLLNDSVSFLGFRKDVPELMSAIDILVVPSHAEAFGNVAIEGMASAKPVVSSNTDGLLDIVVDGETGIHFPPGNITLLSEALSRLIKDKDLRIKLGNAGLKRVSEKFNGNVQFKKFESRFRELINKYKHEPVK